MWIPEGGRACGGAGQGLTMWGLGPLPSTCCRHRPRHGAARPRASQDVSIPGLTLLPALTPPRPRQETRGLRCPREGRPCGDSQFFLSSLGPRSLRPSRRTVPGTESLERQPPGRDPAGQAGAHQLRALVRAVAREHEGRLLWGDGHHGRVHQAQLHDARVEAPQRGRVVQADARRVPPAWEGARGEPRSPPLWQADPRCPEAGGMVSPPLSQPVAWACDPTPFTPGGRHLVSSVLGALRQVAAPLWASAQSQGPRPKTSVLLPSAVQPPLPALLEVAHRGVQRPGQPPGGHTRVWVRGPGTLPPTGPTTRPVASSPVSCPSLPGIGQ